MKYEDLPIDMKGYLFSMPAFWLESNEYSKIISEINQVYNVQYKGKPFATHVSFATDGEAYIYWFENHGYNDYNIYLKVKDNH